MQPTVPEPVFLNVEYLFFLVARAVGNFFSYLFSPAFLEGLHTLATVLVILLIALILYLLVRLYELKKEEEKKVPGTAHQEAARMTAAGVSGDTLPGAPVTRNETWEAIRAKLLSDNQSDWRLAIIEADIYMDKVLDNKGFHGETTSDKLKQITPAELGSVQIAWEAHKVRNRIAHDGASFALTQPEARRVLSYFEIVFRDLEVIT